MHVSVYVMHKHVCGVCYPLAFINAEWLFFFGFVFLPRFLYFANTFTHEIKSDNGHVFSYIHFCFNGQHRIIEVMDTLRYSINFYCLILNSSNYASVDFPFRLTSMDRGKINHKPPIDYMLFSLTKLALCHEENNSFSYDIRIL